MEGLLILVVIIFLVSGLSSASRSTSGRSSTQLPPPQTRVSGSAGNPPVTKSSSGVITDGFQPEDRCICGGKWVKRENSSTGGRFFACSNYPRCRYTRDQVQKIRLGTRYNEVYCSRGHHKPTSGTVLEDSTGRVLCQKCVDNGYVTLREERVQLEDRYDFKQVPTKPTRPFATNPLCRNGHPRTPENTYYRPDGSRECAICRREARKRSR